MTPAAGATHAVETMDGPAWRQTMKDFPIAVLGTALGYGIGKTIAEVVSRHLAPGVPAPGWVKFAPQAMAGVSALSSIAAARTRGILKDRRDAARAADAKIKEAARKLGRHGH